MNHLTNNYGIPNLNFDLGILTSREIEVVERILLPSKNLAFDLNISESTVNSHLTNIKNKTRLADKYQIVYFGTKTGIIS